MALYPAVALGAASLATIRLQLTPGARICLFAVAWSTAEHQKREVELADGFRKQGLQVYVPDQEAFRAHAQKIYLASDEAKEWPKGLLEKINALK